MESLKSCLYQHCFLSAFPLFCVGFETSFGGQWTRRCVLMPPVQQVLEGLETQMMKQLQMNYGVCSDLMSMRAADAQTGTQKSIIHLLPLWLYPRRWGRSLFQLLTFTPKVNLGSLIQLPPPTPSKSLDCVRKPHKATGRTYNHREQPPASIAVLP